MKPIKKIKNAILAVLQQENLQVIDKTLDMLQTGEKNNIFKLPYTFNSARKPYVILTEKTNKQK